MRPKQFCFRCNEPVRGLRRHYRRRHPYDPQPDLPSPPAAQPLIPTPSNLSPVPRTPSPLPRPPQPLQSTPRRAPVPATLVMSRVHADNDDDDDWLQEPLCQVDLLEGVTSPVSSGSGDAPPAPPPRSSAAASALTRRMVDRGTQESGDPEPHRRIRRHLLHPPMHRLQVVDRGDSSQGVTHEEAAFAARHDPGRPRRVCDCASCVAHFVGLDDVSHPAGAPLQPGVHFVHLPSLPDARATAAERQQLNNLVAARPELTLLACGCLRCTVHRAYVRTWLRVWGLPSPQPPEVVATAT